MGCWNNHAYFYISFMLVCSVHINWLLVNAKLSNSEQDYALCIMSLSMVQQNNVRIFYFCFIFLLSLKVHNNVLHSIWMLDWSCYHISISFLLFTNVHIDWLMMNGQDNNSWLWIISYVCATKYVWKNPFYYNKIKCYTTVVYCGVGIPIISYLFVVCM